MSQMRPVTATFSFFPDGFVPHETNDGHFLYIHRMVLSIMSPMMDIFSIFTGVFVPHDSHEGHFFYIHRSFCPS